MFAGEHQKWHDFINNFIKTLHGERLSDLALAQRTANSEVLRFFLRLLPYAIVLGLILGLIKAGVVHALFGK